jgi:N6-L-threonylcarbamoyladenine synthase
MIILSIDTSCDETSVAITEGRKVLANAIYSQVLLHKEWGGVVPSIAKRAHEERIDLVIEECLIHFLRNYNLFSPSKLASQSKIGTALLPSQKRSVKSLAQTATWKKYLYSSVFSKIDYIAVTQGPGLAIALEVGINKAKELAEKYQKKLIAVNHLEGHIYSVFAQNSVGNPQVKIEFPLLAVIVSGGHTEIVLMKDHLNYEVLGETLDDAAGEALDKAAKLIGLGYPGGPVIETIAAEVKNVDQDHFPRPMLKEKTLDFSYSGLKTAFYYHLKKMSDEDKKKQLKTLVSSFQEAVFDVLIKKTERVIKKTGVKRIVVGGGVIANKRLRKLMRDLMKKNQGQVLFPPFKYLTGDNAAMIGIVASYKAEKKLFVEKVEELDRLPRMSL